MRLPPLASGLPLGQPTASWPGLLRVLLLALAGVLLAASAADQLPGDYWQQPLPAQGKAPSDWPALWRDLDPQACGQCHEAQYDAWKESLHAHAFSPGLIGQFPGLGLEEANSCLNCHAPLAEQRWTQETELLDALRLQENPPTMRRLPLAHAGVSCASCHVRGWQRFGPPRKGMQTTGWIDAPAHNGFIATKDFQKSQFCAACHQFPQAMAINGKPLENTVAEWRASRFAREGTHCQDCHMPQRQHLFRGIHDADMTRKGLQFKRNNIKAGAELVMTSVWVGHAFPTYVTPKVTVTAEAFSENGKSLQQWQWQIMREVEFSGGWRELSDTRLMPGESRRFVASPVPAGTKIVVFRVRVAPDHFYKGVYHSLLASDLQPPAAGRIRLALKNANASDYLLYEGRSEVP